MTVAQHKRILADQIHEKLEKIDEILLKAGVTFE